MISNYPEKDTRIELVDILAQNTNASKAAMNAICAFVDKLTLSADAVTDNTAWGAFKAQFDADDGE